MNKKWQTLIAAVVFSTAIVVPTVDAANYTVQKGDTLTKIAKTHNTTIQQLRQWNSLKNNTIYIKQNLVVVSQITSVVEEKVEQTPPKIATAQKQPLVVQQAETVPTAVKVYKVVKGDTLTKIARTYNVSVDNLKQWNIITNDQIYIGQALKVLDSTLAGLSTIETPTITQVEAVVDFEEKQINEVDSLITKQLASENIITTAPSAAGQAQYAQIIETAKELMGVPYVFGGNTTAGFDCSGFVSHLFNSTGTELARKSSLDYFLQNTTQVQQPVPGDIVFFKNTYIATVSHMGIYLGDGEFIHASSRGIEVAKLNTKYWEERFIGYKRFNDIK